MLRYLPKRDIYLAITLGVLGGYYIWNEPLRQYTEERFSAKAVENDNTNALWILLFQRKRLMARNKSWFPTGLMAISGVTLILASVLSYKLYFRDCIPSKHKKAEMYANIVYEKRKEMEANMKL